MISAILLAAWSGLATSPQTLSAPAPTVVQAKTDVEYEKRKTEAGDDPTKLWKLYEWCRDSKREKEGKLILKKIIKVDPNHKDANVALGNLFYDGKWFANQKKIDEYKVEAEAAAKKAQGLVQWKDQWVPAEDVPFLDKGLVRDPSGNWVDPVRAAKLAEGWIEQDLEWIAPAEKENVEKGLWKCGDAWLPIAEADTFHAEIEHWWRIPFLRFHVYTTCERDVAIQKVKPQLENAYDDLARAYGQKPEAPIVVIVFRDKDQYSNFAAGDEDAYRNGTDALGLSSIHHAYFAEAAYDAEDLDHVLGVGVGYWDVSSKDGNSWGVHSVRHALGQSFAEALDPSPKTIQKDAKTPLKNGFWPSFYAEKLIPKWFRYGAAAYAERYFTDSGQKDPQWARKWSISNIQSRGGLRQLKQVIDFNLTVEGDKDSEKLINEAGLVVAFALDGGNAAVGEKLKKFQEALLTKDKKAVDDAAKAFEAEILKHEADLKKFAGL
jgi:hypothetical protein